MKNKIMIVDGMALLFRGFFATSFRGNFMRTSTGIPMNGVHQFLRYFLDATNQFEPTHVICCWDMGSKTFRTEIYDDYKANREAAPEELVPQFDLVKEMVEAFNIPNIGLKDYEADDCIGTLAKEYEKENDVLILTGDLDMLQLVNQRTHVAIMRKGIGNYEVFDKDNFYGKKGLHSHQIVDLKGLMGDSADNYPGVKGIGEKTGVKLLQKYDTIENILANLTELTPTMQNRITTDLEMLHLSRNLAEIKCDVPVKCSLDNALWEYDEERVENKLAEFEFRNLAYFH